MEYVDNSVFAIRNILIYKIHKDSFKDFEYTFLCGVLLNVLSAIYPDGVFTIKFDSVTAMDIPHLKVKTDDSIKEYLRKFRNGLAHKGKKEFVVSSCNGNIHKITIKGKEYEFTDLEKIFLLIEKALYNNDKDIYEKEEKKFMKKDTPSA